LRPQVELAGARRQWRFVEQPAQEGGKVLVDRRKTEVEARQAAGEIGGGPLCNELGAEEVQAGIVACPCCGVVELRGQAQAVDPGDARVGGQAGKSRQGRAAQVAALDPAIVDAQAIGKAADLPRREDRASQRPDVGIVGEAPGRARSTAAGTEAAESLEQATGRLTE